MNKNIDLAQTTPTLIVEDKKDKVQINLIQLFSIPNSSAVKVEVFRLDGNFGDDVA